ncbi:MAG: tetratricopeptide repeat protein [Methanoregula sp.]|nr:tetratricopeptide repeat protein [Methanoregula sp.]WML66934.1 MAG: hypothetical protein METHP_00401 [Methanoregula sp. SKADARSKE-2]
MGKVYYSLGRHEDAIVSYGRALAPVPGFSFVLAYKGSSLSWESTRKRSVVFDKIIETSPINL